MNASCFFFCLTDVAKAASTVLNKSGQGGYPSLLPGPQGKPLSFSPLGMIVAMGFSYVAFRYVEVCSL